MRTFDDAAIEDRVAEIQDQGYCILRAHFARPLVEACREAFWPVLLAYLQAHENEPNRGPNRHYLAMPFEPPCFAPDFFFDAEVLCIVRGLMDDQVVADQWGCDVPVRGSDSQSVHVDFKRALFGEAPDLALPIYMLVISFGLVQITSGLGPIEIAPGTHRMPRADALRAVSTMEIPMRPLTLEIGDVLIRHPWALHRGTPNSSGTPRALVSIRYVRRWYADDSRDVNSIPASVWQSLTSEQRSLLRFPLEG
jgi:hypothetical protein